MSEAPLRIPAWQARSADACFRPGLSWRESGERGGRPLPEPVDIYQKGYAAGERDAALRFDGERARWIELIQNAEALQPEPSQELAVFFAEAVRHLVTQIIGATPLTGEWLLDQAQKAAEMVAACDQDRTMHLHPDDLALLQNVDLPLRAAPDASIERGTIRIDCAAGWVEAGRAPYLDALRNLLPEQDVTR